MLTVALAKSLGVVAEEKGKGCFHGFERSGRRESNPHHQLGRLGLYL
jgi:hypothetical protein